MMPLTKAKLEACRRFRERNRVLLNERAKKRYIVNSQKIKKRRAKILRERKLIVLKHYSGAELKCACCGEKEIAFLTIDNINDKEKKHPKRTITFYNFLIKNNFPEGFQVLCFNCNCAKNLYGVCPHIKVLGDANQPQKANMLSLIPQHTCSGIDRLSSMLHAQQGDN